MNMRQLEAFRATIRSGSITGAAQVMHVSQPSVSRLIADLEHSVGFPLFVRSGRGLVPTAEARRFYAGVEDMFQGIDHLQELARAIRISQGGTLSIGAIQSVSTIELPMAVARFQRDHPDIRFVIQTRNTPGLVEAVMLRQFDLGIVGREPAYDGVEVLFQIAVPYACLMPEDHPLAGEYGPVDLEELAERETFVTFGGTYPDSMMSIDPCLAERLRARSRLSVVNMQLAAALVREAGVLAITDPFTSEQAVRMGGVVFRPLRQQLTYFVSIIAAGREHLTTPAQAFAEAFARQLEDRAARVRALVGGSTSGP
ncbi:MAG: LysR family transcriptional regulator [Rhodobacteraceae bacterium]|nr:LysR family transcriptional regulator [Paracoccaceae bacterium]